MFPHKVLLTIPGKAVAYGLPHEGFFVTAYLSRDKFIKSGKPSWSGSYSLEEAATCEQSQYRTKTL